MIFRGLRDALIAALKSLRSPLDLRDLFVFGGIAAAANGIHMIYPPAAWIFVGIMFFWLGIR